MNVSVPYDEQETTIVYAPANVDKYAEVYTCIPNEVKRMRKLAETRPDAVTIENDLGYAVFARVLRSCVKIQPRRLMTDEQRAVAAERLKKARDKQNDAV